LIYTLHFYGTTARIGPGFTFALRRITLNRTPLDEGSARHRDLYLTAHSTHKRQETVTQAWFEPQSQQASGYRYTP